MTKKILKIKLDSDVCKHLTKNSYWTSEVIAEYLTEVAGNEQEEYSVSFYANEAIKIYNQTTEIATEDKAHFYDHELNIYKFIKFNQYVTAIITDLWTSYLLDTIYNERKNRRESYLFVEEYMQLMQFTQERFKEYNYNRIDLWMIARMSIRKFIFDKLVGSVLDEQAKLGLIDGIDHTKDFKKYMEFVEEVKHNVQATEYYTMSNLSKILGVKELLIANYFYYDLDYEWKSTAESLFKTGTLTFGEIMTQLSFDGKNECIRKLQPEELSFYLNFDYNSVLEHCSADEVLQLTHTDILNYKSTGVIKPSTVH